MPLPPLGAAQPLWLALADCGVFSAGAAGGVVLSWADLHAWQCATGRRLPPWQQRALRTASAAWLAQSRQAKDADCPAPWQSREHIASNRGSVENKLRGAMRLLAAPPRPPKPGNP